MKAAIESYLKGVSDVSALKTANDQVNALFK